MGGTVLKKIACLSLFLFMGISIIVSCSAIRSNKAVKQKKRSPLQIETKATSDSDSIPQTEKDTPELEEVEVKYPLIKKDSRKKVIHIINRVNAITQDSSSIININFNKETEYTTFFLNSPLRFIIDFEKTTIMADEPSILINDPFIKRVHFYKALPGDYARMEIYLKKKPGFNLQRIGNELKLKFLISEAENKKLKTLRTALGKREKEVALLKSKVSTMESDRKNLLNKIKKIDIEKTTDEDKIKKIFNRWIIAWEKKDIDTFMSFYSKKFIGRQMNLDQWKAYKKRTFEKYSVIKVSAEYLKVTIKNSRGKIQFIQNFSGDLYNDTGIKKLYLRQEGDNWKIVKETWNSRETIAR